jgi:hypothetical protein
MAQNDNTISVDEFLSKRKSAVDPKGRLHKGIIGTSEKGAAPMSFNAEAGTCRFTMSAEVEDRDKDIVYQAGLNLKEFLKNPVAPMSHNSRDFPVGGWKDIEQVLNGRPKRTEGTLTLTEGEPNADRLKIHLAAGTVRACSIGFMPLTVQRRAVPENADSYSWPGYEILTAELYECSPCLIPANPAALAKSAEAGGMLPTEILAEVLDTWTLVSGMLMPRKAFEEEFAKHAPGKSFSFQGTNFQVNEKGIAEIAKPAPAPELSLIKRLAKVLGIGDDASKDPASLQDALKAAGAETGTDPVPPEAQNQEQTPEQLAAAEMAKDIAALEELEAIAEAEAEVALLGGRMSKAMAA